MSTTVSQLWKPFSERTCKYSVSPRRSSTAARLGAVGAVGLEAEEIAIAGDVCGGFVMGMGEFAYKSVAPNSVASAAAVTFVAGARWNEAL